MEQPMKDQDHVKVFGQQETEKPTGKLTNWKNEPLISDLKKDFEEATGHHQAHIIDVDTWLDNLHVRGAAKVPKVKGRSTVVPQLIRKQAEWRYAALSEPFLSDEDLFDTAPVTWEDRDAAIQNGLILNNQFNTQIDKTNFIDSPDAMCERLQGGVSLLCRGIMLGSVVGKTKILLRLPYSTTLYLISTGGKTYSK
jgi:hypothetical protein